jgi:tight adherence protein B
VNPLIISFAVFVVVSALIGAAALLLRSGAESRVEDRLAQLTGAKVTGGAKDALLGQSSVLAHPLDGTQDFLHNLLERIGDFSLWFDQANVTFAPSRFFTACGGAGLVTIVLCLVLQLNPVAAVALGLVAGSLPVFWLSFRRKRRFKMFAKQLPDALELIARALRAGHSLGSGFHLVSDEMKAPIGDEFRKCYEEQNLGIPLDEALRTMGKRMPNLDLKFFITAVILQRQTGGDLAEILDKIGHLVRERFAIWGQVQALTGEGRLSGIVLLALPPVLFVAVYRLNPDYVMPLFTDPMGKQMLFGAVIMQLLGAAVIKKIINIRV